MIIFATLYKNRGGPGLGAVSRGFPQLVLKSLTCPCPSRKGPGPDSPAWDPHSPSSSRLLHLGSGIGAVPAAAPAGYQGHSAPLPTDLGMKNLCLPFWQTHRWLEERFPSNLTKEVIQTDHGRKAANKNERIQGSRRCWLLKRTWGWFTEILLCSQGLWMKDEQGNLWALECLSWTSGTPLCSYSLLLYPFLGASRTLQASISIITPVMFSRSHGA